MTQPSYTQQTLRQHFRKMRKQLSEVEQELAAHGLLTQCFKLPALGEANRVACYLSNDGEINPKYVIEWCWQQGKSVLLPIIHPTLPGHLLFVEYHSYSTMSHNRYGIAEPKFNADKVIAIDDIDIIFTPLVAFDLQGNRLGMGGGYYDRTLAGGLQNSRQPRIIGLAHDCQQTEVIPVESWDVPLQGIITASQFFAL